MKIILISIISTFFTITNALSLESIFKSKFYDVNIYEVNISNAKEKEIEKVKILTLNNILKRILLDKDYKKLKRNINIKNEVNFLIKNIIIEDEFISSKKYSAKIKINFDIKLIILLLRKYNINYTDIESSKILFISTEKKYLSEEGLSSNNNFYNNIYVDRFNLLNFAYPQLSPNDRYILTFKDITNNSIISFKRISEKYKLEKIIIVKISSIDNNNNNIVVDYYSDIDNKITNIDNFDLASKINYKDKIFFLLNNWWKQNNLIDNSIINKKICLIKNNNIHELYFINSKINSLSQVKSHTLRKINLGKNEYNIIFYGKLENFSLKLSNYNIKLLIKTNNECSIFMNN